MTALTEDARGFNLKPGHEVGEDEVCLWRTAVRVITFRLRDKVPFIDLHDVIQDAVTKFFTRLTPEERKRITHQWAYLRRVADNAAVDYYRARDTDVLVESWDDFETVEVGRIVQNPFIEHMQKLHLMELVDRIAPDMTEALELFLDGYELAEVADITGRSRKAVHSAFREIVMHLDIRREVENEPVTATLPEGHSEIARAVRSLGPRQAEVLRMSADGLKPRMIAEILSIDNNAVRANKSIAIKSLREKLGLPSSEEVLNRVRELDWGAAPATR
ncbi:LuxR C-terminal-related transcriptional regulator [Saccharothrix syringae]|uniref:HTH luxR-type domain-containing protein n=1 Tax=Saccharothrix syringae TaxID=103733 RepID=A0A5Q0H3R6_SACSY|nr:LuxR C-terminal-related transcriptional regulator [Saccharothrix syringae]QFZ20565.1 hypothetical protein EKG83_26980 [Saccharothrix syringae]